jgi:hypothetical protein
VPDTEFSETTTAWKVDAALEIIRKPLIATAYLSHMSLVKG